MPAPDSNGSTAPARGRMVPWALLSVAVVFVADQLTKSWAVANLTGSCGGPSDHCIDLPAGVTLRLVRNTGAAFSTGTGLGPLLGFLAIGICFALGWMIWSATSRTQAIVFGAILGGALGNIADRVFRAGSGPLSGAVIDIVDVGWWPVFNLADAAIVVGVLSIVALTLWDERRPEAEGEDPAGPDSAEAGLDVVDATLDDNETLNNR